MRVIDLLLSHAVYEGDVAEVRRALAEVADPNASGRMGFPLLHGAAEWGHREVVELLLEHGADVNAPGEDGLTPILSTARSSLVATSRRLRTACEAAPYTRCDAGSWRRSRRLKRSCLSAAALRPIPWREEGRSAARQC